jgi:hypothetical protein
MKRVIGVVLVIICISTVSQAVAVPSQYEYQFSDMVADSRWIDTSLSVPPEDAWFYLEFPAGEEQVEILTAGSYTGTLGAFAYDDVVDDLVSFNITLNGHGDNSSLPINIFLSFLPDHSDMQEVAGYDVDENTYFTLTLDMVNKDLLYNGGDVGDVDMSAYGGTDPFLGIDGFWVGYSCHFWHDSSDVEVTATPEPCSLVLVGLGGLALLRKRK